MSNVINVGKTAARRAAARDQGRRLLFVVVSRSRDALRGFNGRRATKLAAAFGAALVACCFVVARLSRAERPGRLSSQAGGFNARALRVDGESYRYQVFLPRAYTPSARWPVIIAMHGSTQRGTDNQLQLSEGLAPIIRERIQTFPAIVIFPQAPTGGQGSAFNPVILQMLDSVLADFHGDGTRVYFTGMSYGGGVGYDFINRYPERIAAFVPIAATISVGWTIGIPTAPPGPVYAQVARRVHGIPMWIFQGADDTNQPTASVRQIVAALRAAGTNVKYTEYPNMAHDIWNRAYHEPGLFEWLFAQHR